MNIKPPTVRQDLPEEVDFIEEVARIYGYDRLPVTLPRSNTEFKKTRKQQLRDLTKDTLVAMGVSEVQTYSFVSPKSIKNIGIPKDNNNKKQTLRNLVPHTRSLFICAKLEDEIKGLNPSDALELLQSYDVPEAGLTQCSTWRGS